MNLIKVDCERAPTQPYSLHFAMKPELVYEVPHARHYKIAARSSWTLENDPLLLVCLIKRFTHQPNMNLVMY